MRKKQQLAIYVADTEVTCHIRWNRQAKRIILKVINNELILTLPMLVSMKEGIKFIESQSEWVESHIDDTQVSYNMLSKLETLLLHGDKYLFEIRDENRKTHRVITENDKIVLLTPMESTQAQKKNALKNFLRKKAEKKFAERYESIFASNRVPNDIENALLEKRIRFLKGSFGLCYPKDGTIVLNVELVQYPDELIDYVIYHELAHFRHADHSSRFYQLMETFVPNWKVCKKELNELHKTYGGW